MQRKQWVLVGTAGALTLAGLSVGAMGIANAMQVQDAAGSPVAGMELRGERSSTGDGSTPGAKAAAGTIVAPSPTEAAVSAQEVPAPEPVPAPAPVAPADSASAASAGSNG